MSVLRQSTQVVVRIGSFMDATDGVTPETGVTLGAADQAEALKAAGAATVDISGRTWAAITGAGGWYDLTLTTGDTDTVGDLTIVVQDTSVCLPVFARFQVVEEAVFDRLYAASAAGYAIAGDAMDLVTDAVDSAAIATSGANEIRDAILDDATRFSGARIDTTISSRASAATLGTPAGASIAADIVAVKTDTGNLVTRITATLFSGITSLAQWLGLLAGKQVGDATARTEIRATGAGSGTFDETTDAVEAIRDRVDECCTGGGGSDEVNIEGI